MLASFRRNAEHAQNRSASDRTNVAEQEYVYSLSTHGAVFHLADGGLEFVQREPSIVRGGIGPATAIAPKIGTVFVGDVVRHAREVLCIERRALCTGRRGL